MDFADQLAEVITTFVTDLLEAVFGLVTEILQGIIDGFEGDFGE